MKRYIFPDPLDATCRLQPDSLPSPIVGVPDTHPSNGASCQSFDIPDTVPNRHGATLTIEKSGYSPYVLHGILEMLTQGGGGLEFDVFRLQKTGGVRPFHLDGHFCRYSDDGTEMLINEATGFRAFSRYVNGEAAQLEAFLQSCLDHRINMIRVTAMQDTTLYLSDPALRFRIHPDDHQDYYEQLAQFLNYVSGWGLYVDLICCTQTQTILSDPQAQIRHVQRVFDVMFDRHALVSKVNEQGVHDNSVSDRVLQLPKPPGAAFLLSTGSKESGDETALDPQGDLVEIHLNDSNEWWRKGHNAWEMANRYNRAGYVSETTRTDKDGALHHFEDDAKTQTAMTLGALIHTPEGKNADPFTFSLAHLEAHNRGVFAVDLSQRRGGYNRYDNAAVLRDYSMGSYRWQVRF